MYVCSLSIRYVILYTYIVLYYYFHYTYVGGGGGSWLDGGVTNYYYFNATGKSVFLRTTVTILRLGAGRNDGGYENKNLKPASGCVWIMSGHTGPGDTCDPGT